MKNAIFYLIGPPGVGKYAVGRIIAERTAAKLVDNHYSINPIFALIEQDGRTPLPDQDMAAGGQSAFGRARNDRHVVAAGLELRLHPCR
jgi:hypothetical protein